jgi:hypothetical protein
MGWKREAEDMPPKACLVHFPSLSGPALLMVWLVFQVLLWHCFWIFSCFASVARAREFFSLFPIPRPHELFLQHCIPFRHTFVLSSSFQQHR